MPLVYRRLLGLLLPGLLSLCLPGLTQAAISLVQSNGVDIASATSGSLPFNTNNSTGNWIAVCIRAGRSSEIFTVTDSRGNTYQQAAQFNDTLDAPNGNTIAVYYAENISGGANTVTVADTIQGTLRIAILEYSGVATANSLDVTASAQGNSTAVNSGNATTTADGDLLLGLMVTADSESFTTPTGIEIEVFVPAEPGTKMIADGPIQQTAGATAATASLGASDPWGAILAAFKPASAGGSPPSISNINPTSGPVGTAVTITGTNFGTTQGASTVTFNGTSTTPTSWSSTSIVAPVPSGATTGNVVVTVGGTASNGVAFTVIPAPTITSFSPGSASFGTVVTVTGTNFTANNATPAVTLSQQGGGTIPASVTSASATSLSFVIPTGAATGPITVTANGQNAVSSTSLTIAAASSFTLSATPSTATLLPGQTTTYTVSLASADGFAQLASLSVSGLPSGVTANFQPAQITTGQLSFLTLTAPSGQTPSANGLTVTGTAAVQGIAQTSSANVTLQVQGTSGVAFAGRVAVTDSSETPLVGVTVRMMGVNQTGVSTGCTGSAMTDGSGNFLLNGLSASCAGGQLIQYDPSTVTAPAGTYSGVTLSYQLTSGQVTTPGIVVHLPRVDGAETFSVQQNASVDQTFVSRSVPGVSITVYAGTTFTKADNSTPNPFPLSVVEIPYDRLPELMPPDPTEDPVFAMSIEPFNSSSSQPIAVSYPNRSKLAPGTSMPLTSLNPTMGIMQNYGTGTVSADGTQVVPDLDSAHPGHRYGISHFDWHFPLSPGGQSHPCPQGNGCPTIGDPVDVASGLPLITKTDIVLGGARGQVGITRMFHGGSVPGPFGFGTSDNYRYMLDTSNLSGGLINLVMPDGNSVPFVQSGAIFLNSTLPSGQGAVISGVSCLSGFFCSANLRWKDGTTYVFQPNLSGIIGSSTFSLLASVTDANGNKTTLVRDLNGGAITEIIDPGGRSLRLTNDGANVFFAHIQSITDPIGRTVSYHYDSQNRLQTVTDVNGGVTTYGYTDPNYPNSPTTITDARGIQYLVNTYYPDGSGRVKDQQTPDGVTHFDYAQANPTIPTSPVLLTTVTDPLGNKTVFHFNPAGFLLDATDALGRKTVYTRESGTNLLLSFTDPLGRTTAFTYDSAGNMKSITRLAGTQGAVTTSFTYDPVFNKPTGVTDPLGHTTSFGYDKAGNLNKVTNPVDPPSTFGYDAHGELTSVIDSLGNTTMLTYDGAGNLTQTKDPLGRTVNRVPDAVGRTQSITNALGETIQYQYNPLNQVTQITDALNGQTVFGYDNNGNLTSLTDPAGQTHTTSYTFDSMDRLAGRTDPLGHTECYGTLSGGTCNADYDANGNLKHFTDRNGNVIAFQYDAVNRLTSVAFGTQSTISYSYDAGNRLVQAVDSVTGTITRSYDGLDRLTSEVSPRGSVSYSYDAAGRRTGMTVSGQAAVTYQYDNANRLTQITQGSSTVAIQPDSDGRRQSVTLPDGVTMTYGYDAASQLTGINYTLGGNTLGNLTYAYDLAGRRINVGGTFARTGMPNALSSASYNANNQLTQFGGASLTYDANGNLTSDGTNTYTWNARNQLVSISGGVAASFQYDAFGRRVSKTIGGTTQYVYDGANPVQEISGTTASANLLTGGVDEYFQRTDSAGARSYLTDTLGSTLALADSTGMIQTSYTFEPFGNTTVSGASTTNSFAFTGRELDTPNLYFFRARYYNPQLQRFISEDPLGFGANSVNLYGYAYDSPMDYVDPSGMVVGVDDAILAGGGALVGLAFQAGTDLLTWHRSDWQHYVGAGFGGAVGGLALEYTGGIGTGALGSASGNAVTQSLEVLSGKQCSFSFTQLGASALVGAGAGGLVPEVEVPGITEGPNNYNAIAQQIRTKLANQTISNVSARTAGKMLAGSAVGDSASNLVGGLVQTGAEEALAGRKPPCQ